MAKKASEAMGVTFEGNVTFQGPMFDIHDNEHVYVGKPEGMPNAGNAESNDRTVCRNEERFHFVHPEIEDEEAWRIHDAMKRAVANQRIQEICTYLNELREKNKVMLPPIPSIMYNELVRLGMPTGDGYTEKHFRNNYMK